MGEKFKIQLAQPLDFKKHFEKEYYISKKLDGIRAIAFYPDYELLSRTGKKKKGFEHISEELKALNSEYSEKVGNNILVFDGELFSKDIHFNEISSLVSGGDKDKSCIRFMIFAVDSIFIRNTRDMMYALKILRLSNNWKITHASTHSLYFIHHWHIEDIQDPKDLERIVKEFNKKFRSEGYEGVMLRSAAKHYDWKRSRALLKYKSFYEADFEIVGMEEGGGRLKGSMGKLLCSGLAHSDTETDVPVTFKVGSGFSDAARKLFWENQEKFIGKTVEIQYQEISHTVKNEGRKLRIISFLKLKNDR